MRSALSSLVLLAPALALTASATTVEATPPPPVVYDALGDSYASGYGVPPYQPGNNCGRSQSVFAVQLDGRMRIDLDDFASCAGATVPSLVAGGQLEALDGETDLVTLSIGGNDIGWSRAVTACLGGTDRQCADTVAMIRTNITTHLPGALDSVYDQVAAGAPNADVFVTGYPRLFSPEHGALLGASPAEQQELNAGADLLNGVNAPEPWILGPFAHGSFHPNASGYEAYTAAVTAAVKPGRLR
jgi:lysophospholipase L1-like esterase